MWSPLNHRRQQSNPFRCTNRRRYPPADNLVSGLGHQISGHRADVSNPWIIVRQPCFVFMPSFSTALSTQIITPRPVASVRQREPPSSMGFAGDHRGGRLPYVHRVGVHHPGHGLFIGTDVRRRYNRAPGPASWQVPQCIAESDAPALRATFSLDCRSPHPSHLQTNVHHRALPGHPCRQCPALSSRLTSGANAIRPCPAREPSNARLDIL